MTVDLSPIVCQPFTACRLNSAYTLWHNPVCAPDYIRQHQLTWNAQSMAALWGYAIPGGDSFPAERFDLPQSVTMQAEAYGGDGGAGNGGGARAGNLRGVQLKGTGANMFIGVKTDARHGYGALYLEHAITEAIYSQLVSRLLPDGAMTVYGVLATGLEIHFKDATQEMNHRGAGGILLREPCLRPGHFLPAQEFAPLAHQRHVLPDTDRMRQVINNLAATGRGESALEKLLLGFLGRSASQFAWARACRLMHGAVTPTNLSMDGRWLDLSQTSTLPVGVNQRITAARLPFLQERYAPLTFTREILHFYGKYRQRTLSFPPLMRHYELSWQRALREALLIQTGLQSGRSRASAAGARWCDALHALITGHAAPYTAPLDTRQQDDALTPFLLAAYRAVIAADKPLSVPQQALQTLLEEDWHQVQRTGSSLTLRQHQQLCLLRAWRRSAYAPLFWRSRIDALISQQTTGQTASLINGLTAIMDFAFAMPDHTAELSLLVLDNCHLVWSPYEACYWLTWDAQRVRYDCRYRLLQALSARKQDLLRWNFDFLRPLQVLLSDDVVSQTYRR